MPFVKIDAHRYVNTDLVRYVDQRGSIHFADSSSIDVAPAATDYLLTQVESCGALVSEPLTAPALSTRIAQALKFDLPNGAALDGLAQHFPEDSLTEITRALDLLRAENVVVRKGLRFHHAANAISSNPANL